MKSKKILALALTTLAFCSSLLPAQAGVFSVTPVRIYITPKDRAIAITVNNEGDTEIVLQADINRWSQSPEGADELVLTEDLILAPPIIKLAPQSRQVVRLAVVAPRDASRQLTYRMLVREVPEALAAKQGIEIPIALVLSMPVFVTPPTAKYTVTCEAQLSMAKVALAQAVCSNTGTAYAQVREAVLKRGEQTLARFEGGGYVLPGARKTIDLKTEPNLSTLGAGNAELLVRFDDGKSQTFSVTLK